MLRRLVNLKGLFKTRDTSTRDGADRRTSVAYFICSSPRSGSTLLSEALRATERAGYPIELFDPNPKNTEQIRAILAAGVGDYLIPAIKAATTPNGVFGAKLHWYQFVEMRRQVARAQDQLDDADVMTFFSERFEDLKFVRLRRRNRIAQAISYYRARSTRVYSVRTDQAAPSPDVIPYSYEAIAHYLSLIEQNEAGWDHFIDESEISALEIWYEDFVSNYEATIRDVLAYIGVVEVQAIPSPRLSKQADDKSSQWEARFANDSHVREP